jgi:hypothetical protein
MLVTVSQCVRFGWVTCVGCGVAELSVGATEC